MKKHFFIYIITLITLAPTIFSQSNIQLFSDYLPEKYLKDDNNREQFESSIYQFARVNPDLIYYYLNYLNLLAEQNITNRDSNYYNILQYEYSVSSKQNNACVDKEVPRIKNLSESELMDEELLSLLDEYRVPEPNVLNYFIELPIDKNLQQFFTYKYLSRDTSVTYDKSEDYFRKAQIAVEELISQINLFYKDINFYKNEDKYDQNEFLLNNHFLLKGFSFSSYIETKFYLAQYLYSLIDYSEFRIYPGVKFGLNIEIMQHNIPSERVSETHPPYQEFELENTSNTVSSFNITAGYRIKLRNYKIAFSYLDINVGWSFINKNWSDSQTLTINKYIFRFEGRPGEFVWMFNGTIKSISWRINKSSSLTTNLFLPVFYLNHRFFAELGIHYKYVQSEFLVTVEREITDQIAIDSNILAPETETFNHQTTNHLFSGSLSINYSFNNSVNLKGVISTYPSVQIGLEYLLNL